MLVAGSLTLAIAFHDTALDKTVAVILAVFGAAALTAAAYVFSSPPAQPMPGPLPLPGIATVVAVTLLFGVWGIVPAMRHTSTARAEGVHTRRYWAAFWWSLAATALVWAAMWALVAVEMRSALP